MKLKLERIAVFGRETDIVVRSVSKSKLEKGFQLALANGSPLVEFYCHRLSTPVAELAGMTAEDRVAVMLNAAKWHFSHESAAKAEAAKKAEAAAKEARAERERAVAEAAHRAAVNEYEEACREWHVFFQKEARLRGQPPGVAAQRYYEWGLRNPRPRYGEDYVRPAPPPKPTKSARQLYRELRSR